MSEKKQSEHDIQNDILKRFATVGWMRLWRINVGALMTPDGKRMVRTAPTGFPDLSGYLIPSGRAIYIEVKSQRGRATTEQTAFGAMANRSGAVWMLARSVEDIDRALRIEGYGDYVDGKMGE